MGKVKEPSSADALLKEKLELIPKMDFVEDVDAFMKLPENGENTQNTLRRIEETYHRIKLIEQNNASTKRRLKSQLEELQKGQEMLEVLMERKVNNESTSLEFRLADHVFVKARIKPIDTIGLWLGANVMLDYSPEEGEALLREKSAKAEESLKISNGLLDSIREQVTTIEVNMARIYNWDVKRRQAEKEKAGIQSK